MSSAKSTQQPNLLSQSQPPQYCLCASKACLALRKVINSAVSSPNGVVDPEALAYARRQWVSEHDLLSLIISCRRRHEENKKTQRQQLFLRQQQLSSPLGGVILSAFPIEQLKHIASYLDAPSRALFAVALGTFDMSSISVMSAATIRNSGHKRNSDGSLREENTTIGLADIPTESLGHIVSFLSSPSQALFGLAIAAVNDNTLNKNSFAIVGDHWDTLDFGEIEKDLAARLTDNDIKAVLWCIDAGNRVKKLSLAHCVNITGAGLEPLRGSTMIEQIDLSLVGKHENPNLTETWHPPKKLVSFVTSSDVGTSFDPPISCEIVLPILDSIIERGHLSSLKHLQFPMAWRTTTWYHDGGEHSNPNLAFVHFLMRYNRMLMNRGIVSCVQCSRNLPSSGYELVGSSIERDRRSRFTFGNQNHTCSQCMKPYCYRCNDDDAEVRFTFRMRGDGSMLERCNYCEREQCVECAEMYRCEICDNIFCMDCKASTECSNYSDCGNRVCSECFLNECRKCKKEFCHECTDGCGICQASICNVSCGGADNWCSLGADGCIHMCDDCESDPLNTCQQCKQAFCCDEGSGHCRTCNQTFCRDCVTFRRCDGFVPRRNAACKEEHCVDCPDEVFVELARTCAECNKEPCDACITMESNSANWLRCIRCFRTSCHTWQAEKKKLIDEELKESRKGKGSGEA